MLSASSLKLLACVFMFIDHIGVRLFPKIIILRIIGRLAFPIFAFFIAEGCRYTRNKLRHFLSVFILGAICETVYIIYMDGWYGNILLSFSLSILLIYAFQSCAKRNSKLSWAAFVFILAALFLLNYYVNFDYGFTGIISPLFAAFPGTIKDGKWKTKKIPAFAFGIMLTSIANPMGARQLFALLAIPMLALYNGKAGSKKLKYFFYIFYPLHLLFIEAAAMLIK